MLRNIVWLRLLFNGCDMVNTKHARPFGVEQDWCGGIACAEEQRGGARSASRLVLSPCSVCRFYCARKAKTDVRHPFAFDGCPTSVDGCGTSVSP
ncbi:hypothetical protein LR48_Vigan641s002700 [Vigna angularis]|uniref:Uncharacterized protein n=1 Tax=Phaseolus angularis TaxID=3914 RepID=A0A0L9TGI1_PHAAN|nr:hypothetical protein LR48_Vigan641s002700 [Vigna angularis]